MKLFKNDKGFTLIEAIVAVIIIAIITVPIYNIFGNTQAETIVNQRSANSQSEVNATMRMILEDLRKVDSDTTALGNKTIVLESTKPEVILIRLSDTNQIVYGKYNNVLYKYTSSTNVDLTAFSFATLAGGTILARDVTEFSVNQMVSYGYKISIKAEPRGIGTRYVIKPIVVTSTFTPRFNMDIR